jgi:hypothetical protein
MLSRSRNILTNFIVKRAYWVPNVNTNKSNNTTCGFIEYEKYAQTEKQVSDIHMYHKHLNNVNTEQQRELTRIQNNLAEVNQSIHDQKYWIFHSVCLSYVGLFAYIFKM